jgi:hypothetical protein
MGLDAAATSDSPSFTETLAKLRTDCIKRGAVYHSMRSEDDAMMLFVKLFENIEEKRAFLKRRDKTALMLILEEESGNILEVAQLYENTGKYMKAAEIFENAGNHLRAAQCLVKAGRMTMFDDVLLPVTIPRAR